MRRRTTAVMLAVAVIWPALAQTQARSPEARLQAAITKEAVDGDLNTAIEQYRQLASSPNRAVAAKALLRMGECYEKLGDAEARKAYERIVAQFADQKDELAEARRRLTTKSVAAAPEMGLVERQILTFAEPPDPGGISADGRYLALAYFEDDGSRIVLHDVETGQDRTVAGTRDCFQVLLSRDGKLLACSCGDSHGHRELRVLRTDGSGTRTLLSGAEVYSPEDWSPDGKHILARVRRSNPERASAASDMVLISTVDGAVRVLKSGAGVGAIPSSPRFSPDGRYIVLPAVRVDPGGKDMPNANGRGTLHIMRADGSGEAPLVTGVPTELDWSPVWTPDGRRVVFHSDRSGTRALWALRVIDGKPQGEPELLQAQAGEDWVIGFAGDGTLYCLRYLSRSDVRLAEIDPETLKLVSEPRRLNRSFVGSSTGPMAWSPDGRTLAFNHYANSKSTLVVHSMDTGADRELPGVPATVAAWFPDGKSLFAGRQRVDVATGRGEVVQGLPSPSIGSLVSENVALSRDGTTLYYCTSDTVSAPKDGMSHLRLMRRRLETGEERPIYDTISPVSFLHSLALSPDERQLAFGEVLGFASVLKVVPTDGGPAREVLPKFAWGVDWTRDGRYLLARGTWTDGKVQLLVVPLDGGQIRPTGLRTAIPLALHPDGRHIAFQDGGDDAAIVAIKNLIPQKTAQ